MLKKRFLTRTKGLDKLVTAVKKAAKRGYLKGITGRRLNVRSSHAALNVLLQSCGAYVMKYYLVELNERLKENSLDYKFVGNIHDEVQIEIRECDAEFGARLAEEAFITTTNILNFKCKLEGEAKLGDSWADTH